MRYFVRRILLTIPLMLSVTFLVFSMLKLIKGDPAKIFLGQAYTEKAAAEFRAERGLDRPFLTQYFKWLGNVFRGDLGKSYFRDQSVARKLADAFPVTLQLVLLTMFLTLLISIPLGLYSAYRVGSPFDRAVSGFAFGFLSFPGFVLGLILQMLVVYASWIHLPVGNHVPLSENVLESFRHMFLPALTLSLGLAANYVRTLRTDTVGTLQEDFISLAKTKGLSDRRILWRHAFRPSSITLMTVAGINFGQLIGNSLIVEQIFQLPGIGRTLIQALLERDYLVVLGVVSTVTIAFVLLTTLIDLLYGVVDPRVRHMRSIA
jgi:peptide/nickel transport system permease protein